YFFSSRRRHTRCYRDWSSDVCSSDLDDRLTLAGARCAVLLIRAADPSVRVDDHLVLLEETIGDPDRLLEQPARVAPQVENEARHPLLFEGPDAFVELPVGGAREVLDLDVAHAGTDQERLADAVGRNVVARDREV